MIWEQLSLDDALALAEKEPASFSAIVSQQNKAEVPGINPDDWGKQLRDVYQVMKSGRWFTLAEVAFHTGHPEASVSARIRDLARKGIPHQKRKAKEGGLYEYCLVS